MEPFEDEAVALQPADVQCSTDQRFPVRVGATARNVEAGFSKIPDPRREPVTQEVGQREDAIGEPQTRLRLINHNRTANKTPRRAFRAATSRVSVMRCRRSR